MENQDAFLCGMNMIYLAACALHGKSPIKAALDEMDLAGVHKQAARHSMHAVTYEAISLFATQNGREALSIDDTLLSRWGAERVNAIRHAISFDMERERLLRFLEERGVWYVLLKGLVMQTHYPKLGMRQMCDNDILFDPAYRKDVCEFMKQNGYKVDTYGKPYPDVYLKDRYNFEMHHQLYFDSVVKNHQVFNPYYQNVKDRLQPASGCQLRFSDEDFYVYSVAHSYKHYVVGGNGIRALMDIYVYLHSLGDRLDMDYVKAELKKLHLSDYHEWIKQVAYVLFADADVLPADRIASMDEEMRDFVAYSIDSGTYGTLKHHTKNRLRELSGDSKIGFGGKIKYLWTRIFPGVESYRTSFPFAYRHKILIPVFWFYRLLRGMFCRPLKLLSEWRYVLKTK